jgi:hypothetical protein
LKLTIGVMAVSMMLALPVYAQKIIDPDRVAPEYRKEAEQRRGEQISRLACAQKATAQKVLPRDRPDFINNCVSKAKAEEAKE